MERCQQLYQLYFFNNVGNIGIILSDVKEIELGGINVLKVGEEKQGQLRIIFSFFIWEVEWMVVLFIEIKLKISLEENVSLV